MKQDKYLRARGGKAELIKISCAKCDKKLLEYQKDGIGYLHRCYLNRIVWPKKFQELQFDQSISKPSEMLNLKCDCGELVGVPMRHSDGRLAYRLERGSFKRKRATKHGHLQ